MEIAFVGDSITEGVPGASYLKMLSVMLPTDTLINYGKGGDTVKSLLERLKKIKLKKHTDLIVLWIGVNDVFAKLSVPNVISHAVTNQFPATSLHEFKKNYSKIVKHLLGFTNKLFIVTPLFIGEDFQNEWNREVENYLRVIWEITEEYSQAEYVNLREIFISKLSIKKVSDYLPENGFENMSDALLMKMDEINNKSKERGLFYTLDGVHLNELGAQMVAEYLAYRIKYALL